MSAVVGGTLQFGVTANLVFVMAHGLPVRFMAKGEEDPSPVERFVTAIDKSLTYTESHPSAACTAIPTYTKISASVAAKMPLPKWGSALA